jgi:hypothetical protein
MSFASTVRRLGVWARSQAAGTRRTGSGAGPDADSMRPSSIPPRTVRGSPESIIAKGGTAGGDATLNHVKRLFEEAEAIVLVAESVGISVALLGGLAVRAWVGSPSTPAARSMGRASR